MNPKVEQFLSKAKKWQDEMTLLREMVLECNLEEDFKWMHPCYTLDNANIVLIHGFKEYCALLFFKGVLLKTKKEFLSNKPKMFRTGVNFVFKVWKKFKNWNR